MKIGLDLRMAGGGSGIDRYITELAHEILKQDKTHQYVLFVRNEETAKRYREFNQKIVIADIAHYSLAEQARLPKILERENLDLVHFPHFNVPLRYNKPFVATIHDLTHTLFPGRKKSHFFHRLAYRAVFNHAVRNSKAIIAVSEATKKQILEHYLIPAKKIRVIYEGFSGSYKIMDKNLAFAHVAEKFGITRPFLLYVGVWRRYKNLPLLARAFDRLVARGLDLELVLAGEPDAAYPEIAEQVKNIPNQDRIKAVGRVSDEDLNLLYNAARIFVLPSQIEGFGLTALEAAAVGTPVVCSDIPALREIMGQGAEYFDPENLDNMAEVLENLWHNDRRLEELANSGLSRSKHFSWSRAAEETIKLYESALSKSE
jgi:glycosyltransferase involved in cell wall biosynthesis